MNELTIQKQKSMYAIMRGNEKITAAYTKKAAQDMIDNGISELEVETPEFEDALDKLFDVMMNLCDNIMHDVKYHPWREADKDTDTALSFMQKAMPEVYKVDIKHGGAWITAYLSGHKWYGKFSCLHRMKGDIVNGTPFFTSHPTIYKIA